MKKIKKALLILSTTLLIIYALYLIAYFCLFDNKLIKNIFIISIPYYITFRNAYIVISYKERT